MYLFPTEVWNHMKINTEISEMEGKSSLVIDEGWIEDKGYMCGHNRFANTLPSN